MYRTWFWKYIVYSWRPPAWLDCAIMIFEWKASIFMSWENNLTSFLLIIMPVKRKYETLRVDYFLQIFFFWYLKYFLQLLIRYFTVLIVTFATNLESSLFCNRKIYCLNFFKVLNKILVGDGHIQLPEVQIKCLWGKMDGKFFLQWVNEFSWGVIARPPPLPRLKYRNFGNETHSYCFRILLFLFSE